MQHRTSAGPSRLADKLLSFSLSDGGLPYYRGNASSAEPALLALLALFAAGAPAQSTKPLLLWISGLQNPDGSLALNSAHRDQGIWLTALAAIVFHHYGLRDARSRALGYTTSLRSVTVPNDPKIKQDNSLIGWPWIPGTFGWVEPTSWAVVALNVCGLGGHARAVEGQKFLLDRQIPSGGWNYGNPGINDRELLPFWDTTGLALVALGGQADIDRVRPSLDLLDKRQDKIESVSGLAWATLGLQSFGRDASRLKTRLLNMMDSWADTEVNLANFAVGMIALSGKKVFAP